MDSTIKQKIEEHLAEYIRLREKKGSKYKMAKMFGGGAFYLIPKESTYLVEDESPTNGIYKIAVAIRMVDRDNQRESIWFTYWFFDSRNDGWQFGGQNSLLLPVSQMRVFLKIVGDKWFR